MFKIGQTVLDLIPRGGSSKLGIITDKHDGEYSVLFDTYNDPIRRRAESISLHLEDWPNNGIDFNRWYCNVDRFMEVLNLADFQWYTNSRFKYFNLRIDSRNKNFLLFDTDGNRASPIDMFNSPLDTIS